MNFTELAKLRYSCRKFSDKEVEPEIIEKILEAGHLAPTGCNYQPQKILVLTDKKQLEKVKECTRFGFNAPLNFLICFDRSLSYTRGDGKNFGEIDTCIVATHMILKAAELGIGSTWVGAFNPGKTREVFNIPENLEILGFFPMGYPAEDAAPAKFHEEYKDPSEIVFYNNF